MQCGQNVANYICKCHSAFVLSSSLQPTHRAPVEAPGTCVLHRNLETTRKPLAQNEVLSPGISGKQSASVCRDSQPQRPHAQVSQESTRESHRKHWLPQRAFCLRPHRSPPIKASKRGFPSLSLSSHNWTRGKHGSRKARARMHNSLC